MRWQAWGMTMSISVAHLATFLHRRTLQTPDAVALRYKRGGEWSHLTFEGWRHSSLAVAQSLAEFGIGAGDRIVLVSSTRSEWAVLAWAVAWRRAVMVPLASMTPLDEVALVIESTAPKAVFVEDPAALQRLLPAFESLKGRIFCFDTECVLAEPLSGASPYLRLEQLKLDRDVVRPFQVLASPAIEAAELEALFLEELPEDAAAETAAIFFTPGTLKPKGVVLSHASLVYQARTLAYVLPISASDTLLLFLPLSHALGAVSLFASVAAGAPVALSGGVRTLLEDLQAAKPTVLVAVPRVYEKMAERLQTMVAELPLVWREVVRWGLKAGREQQRASQGGDEPDLLDRVQLDLAKKTVFPQFRDLFGGRMRFMISSAAPLSRDVAYTLGALGIPLLEAYGLTEAGGATHINRPDSMRIGTVGQPLPMVETMILPDGEIAVRSPSLMQGYWKEPIATQEALVDGWLHTSDQGTMSPDGFLTITGRKKNIILNASGKGISPQKIENLLREIPLVAHAVVEGEGRAYLVAVLTLKPSAAAEWAHEHGITSASLKDLARSQELYRDLERSVNKVNGRLAPHERVRAFAVLDREFSLESGELTSDFKVKRSVVLQQHKDAIEMLYRERF